MKSGIKRGKQEFFPIFPCLDFEFVSDFGIRISNFLFEDLFERGLVSQPFLPALLRR